MPYVETEVVVVGVGAMGSAALWQLAERGVPAIGFERFEPGHDRGSSHGESRIFRTAYLEGPSYVPLAQRAIALWHELQRISGVPLVIQNGAISLGPRDSSIITSTLESIRVHDLPHHVLDTDEVRSRYPAHRIADGVIAIHEYQAGFVLPEAAIIAAARRATDLGARLLCGHLVDRIQVIPGGVRITSGDITCEARHAVVSVGSWLGQMLPDLSLPLRVTRQVVGWFPIEKPEQFESDRFPVFLRDIGNEGLADSTFYGFPSLDGATIKVSVHREGNTADPDNLDRAVSSSDLEPIASYVQRYLVDVQPHPVRTSVCMYTNTPDHDFIIGSPLTSPQITILGGFSGHGFKFAPVIGQIAAELATVGHSDQPIDWLSPSRFSAQITPASG